MRRLDLMSKKQLFRFNDNQRVRARQLLGYRYDFWIQEPTKKIRDTVDLLDDVLQSLASHFKIPRILVLKQSKLKGWAGCDQVQDILFISDILHSREAAQDILLDNYFSSKTIDDILVHELTHKRHWDSAKAFYKQHHKTYNSLEEAKNALDAPVVSYIKRQVLVDPFYLSSMSDYAKLSAFNGYYNEVIAELMVNPYGFKDSHLFSLVREVLKWK